MSKPLKVIFLSVVILLLIFASIGVVYAAKPVTVSKIINWLGIGDTPPTTDTYGIYYNTAPGTEGYYLYDGFTWSLMAEKGPKGDKGDPGITEAQLADIFNRLSALESIVSSLQSENTILKDRLNAIAPISNTPSHNLSLIEEGNIVTSLSEEFHFVVSVKDAENNPINGLSASLFSISDGEITKITPGLDGRYTVSAKITNAGDYTIKLTVKEVTLVDTVLVQVLVIPSATLSKINENDFYMPLNQMYTSFNVYVADGNGNPMNNLSDTDFKLSMGLLLGVTTPAEAGLSNGIYKIDVQLNYIGIYNIQVSAQNVPIIDTIKIIVYEPNTPDRSQSRFVTPYVSSATAGGIFQFVVHIGNAAGDPITTLFNGDFSISGVYSSSVTHNGGGDYMVTAIIKNPGSYNIGVSAKGVWVSGTLPVTVGAAVPYDGYIYNYLYVTPVLGVRVNEPFTIKVHVNNYIGDPVDSLAISDFVLLGSAKSNADITAYEALGSGDYNLTVVIKSTDVTNMIVTAKTATLTPTVTINAVP